ncbi:hypothetical protein GF319_05385 [Candidatus Bathyarchaeota archaeon]|nr:hypothetical protein [Candidatus Bathyarchaeota archaeon]
MKSTRAELLSEFLGSMFLTLAAISPMILFPIILGSTAAIAVVADALVVGFVLFVLIEMFGPVSGAHFNPIVSIGMTLLDKMDRVKASEYIVSQISGGFLGLLLSHLMFFHEVPILIHISTKVRNSGNYLGEIIGTFALVLTILMLIRNNSPRISFAIGLLVSGQLMATSSTMFANPMITIVRAFTYSDAGVRPFDAVIFILMQLFGMLLATKTWLIMKEE